VNIYRYTENNPTNLIDPLGLIWVTIGYDYHGVRNWSRGILNYITDRIGTGMEDPNLAGSSPNHYVGIQRDVIQEWQHDENNPCRDNERPIGEKRTINQEYKIFINGGPSVDLINDPDTSFYYQWSPWVGSPTYDNPR